MESPSTDSESVAEMSDDEVTPSSPPAAEIQRQLTGAPFPGTEVASEQIFSAPTRRIEVPSNHRRRVAIAAAGAVSLLVGVAFAIATPRGAGAPAGAAVRTTALAEQSAGYLAGKQLGARLAVPPPDTALHITSYPPGAEVYIDGEPALGPRGVLHTDVDIPGLAPGAHVVELKPSLGWKPWREQVDVAVGSPTRLTARFAKLRRR